MHTTYTHTVHATHMQHRHTLTHTPHTHTHTAHTTHTRHTHTYTGATHTCSTRALTRDVPYFFPRVSLYVLRLNPASPSNAPRAGKPKGKAGRFALRKSLRLPHAIRLSRETFTARCPADQKARPLGAGGRSTRARAARRGAIHNREGRCALCFSQTGQPHVPYLLDACAACSFSEVA